jgi:hypothetical protein
VLKDEVKNAASGLVLTLTESLYEDSNENTTLKSD